MLIQKYCYVFFQILKNYCFFFLKMCFGIYATRYSDVLNTKEKCPFNGYTQNAFGDRHRKYLCLF